MPRKLKSLEIEIPSYELSPNGAPVIYSCVDMPATVHGRVIFEANYECKGHDIVIEYSAMALARWQENRGQSSVACSGVTRFDRKSFLMKLRHDPTLPHIPSTQALTVVENNAEAYPSSTSSVPPGASRRERIVAAVKNPRTNVLPERYVGEFAITINPKHPSSCKVYYGHVTYLIRATLHRAFPSRNIVREQKLWVFNTSLPKPTAGIPIDYPTSWQKYSGFFEGKMPYTCILPPSPIYPGQSVPVLIKIDPAMAGMPTPEETERMTRESVWQVELVEKKKKRAKLWSQVTRQPPAMLDLKPEEPIRVMSAIIKLKEYVWYISDTGSTTTTAHRPLYENIKNDNSGLSYGIPVSDIGSEGDFVKPCPAAGQSWRKVVVVKIPDIWNINPNVRCQSLLIQHNFKVLLTVKVGNHPAKDLRIDRRARDYSGYS
ncbi:hypothetical protein EDD21DRAFT_405717 [Dissophora ornata]|nr:hypothetical protein EDD21DRAFT_405717 [Dissophora ornata]